MFRTRDKSDEYIKWAHYLRVELLKENLEGTGIFMGDTGNDITYRNHIGQPDDKMFNQDNILNGILHHLDMFGVGGGGKWSEAVRTMAAWYLGPPINGKYDQSSMFDCPLTPGRKVRSDCSGFVTACLWLYGLDIPLMTTSAFADRNSPVGHALTAAGFTYNRFDDSSLQPFAICVTGGHGHVTIVGEDFSKKSWNCYDFGSDRGPKYGKPLPMHYRHDYAWMIYPPLGSNSLDASMEFGPFSGTMDPGKVIFALHVSPKSIVMGTRFTRLEYVQACIMGLDRWGPACGLTQKGKLFLLAQMAQESGNFLYLKEIGGASKRYAPYYGRGPIQVTWLPMYRQIQTKAFPRMGIGGVNIVSDPGCLERSLMLAVAGTMGWVMLKPRAVSAANSGDVKALTRAVNGGLNGLATRLEYTRRIYNACAK
jgi:predicted chitinase